MSQLSDMVIGMTGIIVLATLLEMIIPNSSMKKFVEGVVGLFVLVTILNPIVNLIKADWSTNLQAFLDTQEFSNQAVEKGKSIAEDQMKLNNSNYSKKLAQQILAIGNLIEGVEINDVSVNLSENQDTMGRIESIKVNVKVEDDNFGANEIDKVNIRVNEREEGETVSQVVTNNSKISEDRKNRLVNTLVNLYGVSPSQIEINAE